MLAFAEANLLTKPYQVRYVRVGEAAWVHAVACGKASQTTFRRVTDNVRTAFYTHLDWQQYALTACVPDVLSVGLCKTNLNKFYSRSLCSPTGCIKL